MLSGTQGHGGAHSQALNTNPILIRIRYSLALMGSEMCIQYSPALMGTGVPLIPPLSRGRVESPILTDSVHRRARLQSPGSASSSLSCRLLPVPSPPVQRPTRLPTSARVGLRHTPVHYPNGENTVLP